jgi:MFS family permease
LYSENLVSVSWSIIIIALLTGISASGMVIAFAMVSEIIPKKMQGTAMGVNNTSMIAGAAFGQVLFGYFLVNYNIGNHIKIQINPEYYTALLILPASAMIAFIFIVFGTRKMS